MQRPPSQQHVRVHEGVRDHAVHRARQRRQTVRGCSGNVENHAHHRTRATQVRCHVY